MTVGLRDLLDRIRYELAEGIHTCNPCKCGRYSTRRDKCVLCLMEGFLEGLDSLNEKTGDTKNSTRITDFGSEL